MKTVTTIFACIMFFLVLHVNTSFTQDRQKEFEAIGKMSPRELAPRAKAALEKKYPGENWEKYRFPKYVYTNDEVTAGYMIAVKEPDLLAKFPCYCFCEGMGHKNLSYCFLKQGKVEEGFDSHAAGCNTCDSQAMTAFLWNELGVDIPKMQQGMKQTYKTFDR